MINFFLLSTDSMYSRVPGDQAGPIFFGLKIFLAVVLHTNWCTTICITCPILCKIECNEFVCNKFVLGLLQIDIIQSVLYKLLSVSLPPRVPNYMIGRIEEISEA